MLYVGLNILYKAFVYENVAIRIKRLVYVYKFMTSNISVFCET